MALILQQVVTLVRFHLNLLLLYLDCFMIDPSIPVEVKFPFLPNFDNAFFPGIAKTLTPAVAG